MLMHSTVDNQPWADWREGRGRERRGGGLWSLRALIHLLLTTCLCARSCISHICCQRPFFWTRSSALRCNLTFWELCFIAFQHKHPLHLIYLIGTVTSWSLRWLLCHFYNWVFVQIEQARHAMLICELWRCWKADFITSVRTESGELLPCAKLS